MIWNHAKPSEEDKKLLEDTQEQAKTLRQEALEILVETRSVAGALRNSRERNHYREALDEVFMGRIWKKESGT